MSDLSPDARSLIAAAVGGDDPSDADRSRVRAAVLAHIAAGAAAMPAADAATTTAATAKTVAGAKATAAASGLAAKLLVGSLLVTGLAVGGYTLLRDRGDSGTQTPQGVSQQAATSAPATAATLDMPDPRTGPSAHAPAAAAVHEATTENGDSDHRATPAEPSTPQPTVAATHKHPTRNDDDAKRTLTRKPKPHAIRKPTSARAATTAKPSQPAADPMASLLAEKKLISEANAALRAGNATNALALLDRHATQHPRGVLSANRSGARVLALCSLGKTAAAQREATRFLARWSKHPMAERVRRSCAANSD